MLLQALGNFYMGVGMLLGGGSASQPINQHCDKSRRGEPASRRELEARLANLESVQYSHSQPRNSITINNSNTLVSR